VRRSATPKLHAYLALVAVVLVAAFLARRPEMVVVATPFAFALVFALPRAGEVSDVRLAAQWSRERVIEGDALPIRLTVGVDHDVQLLDITIVLPSAFEPSTRQLTISELRAGEQRTIELDVRCKRWGLYTWVRCELAARSAQGFFRDDGSVQMRPALRVYPQSETLRAMVRPRETQPSAGNLVARGVGSGIEFAEIRPFQPGDELRQVIGAPPHGAVRCGSMPAGPSATPT
jgi:uncharacterized protein (DUF58 family)